MFHKIKFTSWEPSSFQEGLCSMGSNLLCYVRGTLLLAGLHYAVACAWSSQRFITLEFPLYSL